MQLFVPEKTLEEIQCLLPELYKIHSIPALIDYAIDLKQKSGSVFLFECNQKESIMKTKFSQKLRQYHYNEKN